MKKIKNHNSRALLERSGTIKVGNQIFAMTYEVIN